MGAVRDAYLARRREQNNSSSSSGSNREMQVTITEKDADVINIGGIDFDKGEITSSTTTRGRTSSGSGRSYSSARRRLETNRAQQIRAEQEKAARLAEEAKQQALQQRKERQLASQQQAQAQQFQEQQFLIQQQRGLNEEFGTRSDVIPFKKELSQKKVSGTLDVVDEDAPVFLTGEQLQTRRRRKEGALDFFASFNPLTATVRAADVGRQDEVIVIESAEKGVPLYPEIEQQSGRMAGLLAAGAVGAVQKPFSAARSIDVIRAEELAAEKTIFAGTTKQEAGETVLDLVGGRQTPSGRQTFSGQLTGTELGKGRVGTRFAGEGQIKATTEIDSFLGTIQAGGKRTASVTDDVIKVFGKGEVGKTQLIGDEFFQLPEGIRTVVGQTTSVRQPITVTAKGTKGGVKVTGKVGPKQTQTSGFTGFSITEGTDTAITSGRIGAQRFYRGGRVTGKAPQQQFGVVRELVEQSSDDAGRVIRTSGKKSSPEFFQQLYQDDVSIGLQSLGQTTTSTVKPAVTTPRTVPSFNPAGFLAGENKQVQVSKPQGGRAIEPATFDLIVEPITVRRTRVETTPRPGTGSRTGGRGRQKPRTDEATIIDLDVLQDTTPGQDTRQGTRTVQRQTTTQPPFQPFVPLIPGGGIGRLPPAVPKLSFDFPDRRRGRRGPVRRGISGRRPQKFVTQLTGFEAALGLTGRKVRAGTFTGFEVTRGVRRKKKVVAKKKTKSKKKPAPRKPKYTLI